MCNAHHDSTACYSVIVVSGKNAFPAGKFYTVEAAAEEASRQYSAAPYGNVEVYIITPEERMMESREWMQHTTARRTAPS